MLEFAAFLYSTRYQANPSLSGSSNDILIIRYTQGKLSRDRLPFQFQSPRSKAFCLLSACGLRSHVTGLSSSSNESQARDCHPAYRAGELECCGGKCNLAQRPCVRGLEPGSTALHSRGASKFEKISVLHLELWPTLSCPLG